MRRSLHRSRRMKGLSCSIERRASLSETSGSHYSPVCRATSHRSDRGNSPGGRKHVRTPIQLRRGCPPTFRPVRFCDTTVSMATQAVQHGTEGGRAPLGKGDPVQVRIQPAQMVELDGWIAKQEPPRPSRAEAIRRLVGNRLVRAREAEAHHCWSPQSWRRARRKGDARTDRPCAYTKRFSPR